MVEESALRIVRVVSIVAAVVVAFVLGHVTAPPRAAEAQMQTSAPGTAQAVTAGVGLPSLRCYGAQFGPQLPAQVSMRDQFQSSETLVTTPQLFCVPAATTVHSTKPAPVDGVADRLTCYASAGTAYAQTHTAVNELGKFTVTNFVPRLLCVPTHQD